MRTRPLIASTKGIKSKPPVIAFEKPNAIIKTLMKNSVEPKEKQSHLAKQLSIVMRHHEPF